MMNNSQNITITEFLPEFKKILPETYHLLLAANLTVHPNVRSITLHGSRGLAGKYHPDSDIDLSLITDLDSTKTPREQLSNLLETILKTTLENNRCPVELDLAAIFDYRGCGLACFNVQSYSELRCGKEAAGCLGIYKIQKGFNGFIPPMIQISKMYPLIEIWRRQ
jgi:hypothetical protein